MDPNNTNQNPQPQPQAPVPPASPQAPQQMPPPPAFIPPQTRPPIGGPIPPQAPPVQHGSGMGLMLATILVLAVVIVGAIYFWQNRTDDRTILDNEANSFAPREDADTEASIEADLNTTDIDSVDYDLNEDNFNAS